MWAIPWIVTTALVMPVTVTSATELIALFTDSTFNSYVWPFVTAYSKVVVLLGSNATKLESKYTLYPVTVKPFAELSGATHESVKCPSEGTTLRPVGAEGLS